MKTAKIIEKNKAAIGLLDIVIPGANNESKISIRGTGFVTSKDGVVVTNAHVYQQIPENEKQYLGIKLPSETDQNGITRYDRYDIDLLDIDQENDIALMKIKSDKPFSSIIGIENPDQIKEGDEVIFLGYPLALELIMMKFGVTFCATKAMISSIKRRAADGSLHFFMIDTHINNGSSGSPLFSVSTGKIIGIASGKISSKIPAPDGRMLDIPANMGICRPSNYIMDIINKNISSK